MMLMLNIMVDYDVVKMMVMHDDSDGDKDDCGDYNHCNKLYYLISGFPSHIS